MKHFLKEYSLSLLAAFREVYQNRAYYVLTISVAILLFSLNAVARNYRLLAADFSFLLLVSLITGSWASMAGSSFFSLLVISLVAGISISFTIFLIKRQVTSAIHAGSLSVVLTLLAPACPSCAVSLLGIFSLGGIITILPFQGQELGIIGVIIVLLSIFYLSRKITTATCPVVFSKKK